MEAVDREYYQGLTAELRTENLRLRSALTQFVAAFDTAPPMSFVTEMGMACVTARAALTPSLEKA